ncbi:uncharacterized protein FPOAC1_014125 [Fusarium poae]|uniref:uncharacterized protein n=1 Tax=Fusarium poae TaxID=36050 RepID=UPI001D03D21C|nr:uncharacterized protein FPOAC1_014125 [Fusarium poae]KAG8664058.1 hypothetical protein FPOAC1_014125 [Fusarium poae]
MLATLVIGANGVVMPGLTVLDGTPRSVTSAASGGQVDTSVIRDPELGSSKASALGRTSKGPVDPARVIKRSCKVSRVDPLLIASLEEEKKAYKTESKSSPVGGLALEAEHGVNGLLDDFFQTAKGVPSPRGYIEDSVQKCAGAGAKSGLPTTASDGTLKLIYHQVLVKVPAGKACSGTVAGVSGVCIARVRNSATAGPFGGAAAFTHHPKAAKAKPSSAKFRHRHV